MKKSQIIAEVIVRSLLLVSIISCYFLEPMSIKAAPKANTLAGLRKELKEYQAKKSKAENDKKLTQNEINNNKNQINNNYKEIEESENQITQAKNDIESSRKKIEEYKKETEELMAFYQIMSGENNYLEFISDSSSMTELIMRIDAVESIAKYNKEKLTELDTLIKDLNQKQVDLKNYETELSNKITNLEKNIDKLNSNIQIYDDDKTSAEEEIENIKNVIKVYEDMGCKENEDLDVCASRGENNTFLKPVVKGRITSVFGPRTVSGQSSNHSGIDIGLAEGTPVYSMVNGTVFSITNKASCGGNKVYINAVVKGKKYTVVYLHLLKIDVKIGQEVTTQTVIGKSGGYSTSTKHGGYDRCTTGAHLHVSVAKEFYTGKDAPYRANLINPPGFPGKGGWFYSRTQWFGPKL